MATITKDNTFSAGATIVASEHNDNFDTIFNDYNTNITNVNISASAAIVDTKLAQLTTASKVNLSALVISSQVAGDIIYASSASALTRLAGGVSGQVLQTAGTAAPSWTDRGKTLQLLSSFVATSAAGTNIIPFDNTNPAVTEGNQFLTLAVTPAATANQLKIDVTLFATEQSDTGANLCVALFQDVVTSGGPTTSNSIASGVWNVDTQALSTCDGRSFSYIMSATTTAEITFTVRGGINAGGIIVNGTGAGTARMGGSLASSLIITEVSA